MQLLIGKAPSLCTRHPPHPYHTCVIIIMCMTVLTSGYNIFYNARYLSVCDHIDVVYCVKFCHGLLVVFPMLGIPRGSLRVC